MISPDDVKAALHYCPETGAFTWRHRPNLPREWNTRWAGKSAGRGIGGGYVAIRINAQSLLAHRLAWAWVHGAWPTALIDHVNGNPSDNRICNLREATAYQNVQNTKRPVTNTSGVRGVHFDKVNRKWMAFIKVEGRFRNLGRFADKADATAARAAAERSFHDYAPTEAR